MSGNAFSACYHDGEPACWVFGAGGFACGYWASKVAGLPEKAARTNSIEVTSLSALCHTLCLPPLAALWLQITPRA